MNRRVRGKGEKVKCVRSPRVSKGSVAKRALSNVRASDTLLHPTSPKKAKHATPFMKRVMAPSSGGAN
jgi:hypothetical protein